MKPILTLSIILLTMSTAVFARDPYTIRGTILDPEGKPVVQAFVWLQHNADNSLMKTGVSDSSGNYVISSPTVENTSLSVSATGFIPQTYLLPESNPDNNIEVDFSLEYDKHTLMEVVVEQKKPLFEHKIDRIIFNVANSISATGSNAWEMIGKSPGVIVDPMTNVIRLSGKGAVQVMINGILLQLSGEALVAHLQAIPAENLERIEVITAPPAKYDASGNSGLINLVLKKNTHTGLNGMLSAGYGQASHGSVNGNANLNFRSNKWNIFGDINYSKSKNTIIERLNTPYTTHAVNMEDRHIRILQPWSYRLGVDYELHKNAIIGATFQSSPFLRSDDENITNRVFLKNQNNVDSLMHTLGDNRQEQNTHTLNLNYEWAIDTAGKNLSINVNRLWYTGHSHKNLDTRNYTGEFLSPTGAGSENQIGGNQNVHITTAQADMQMPNKWFTLSFGGKMSFIDNLSNNYYRYFKDGQYQDDPNISNTFDYSENVQALYTNVQKQTGKWGLQAGLRGEFTQTKGHSVTLNQTHKQRYLQLFPTAYLQYRINEINVLTLNYSRRISRPSYSTLNPFRSYSSPYFYSEGNPYLQPYFSHSLEGQYSFKYMLSIGAFFQFADKTIDNIWVTQPYNSVTYMKPDNVFSNKSYGLWSMVTLQPTGWWDMQASASLSYQQQSTDYDTRVVQLSIPVYSFYTSNTISLNAARTFLAEVTGSYYGKSIWGPFEWAPMFYINGGVKALFFDKNLTVSLQANDIFQSLKNRKALNKATGQTLNNDLDLQSIRLSVSYKFGSKKIKSSRDRKMGIEEEKGRM